MGEKVNQSMHSILLAKPTKTVNDVPVWNTVKCALENLSSTSMAKRTTTSSAKTTPIHVAVTSVNVTWLLLRLMLLLAAFGILNTILSGPLLVGITKTQTTAQAVLVMLLWNVVKILTRLLPSFGSILTENNVALTVQSSIMAICARKLKKKRPENISLGLL